MQAFRPSNSCLTAHCTLGCPGMTPCVLNLLCGRLLGRFLCLFLLLLRLPAIGTCLLTHLSAAIHIYEPLVKLAERRQPGSAPCACRGNKLWTTWGGHIDAVNLWRSGAWPPYRRDGHSSWHPGICGRSGAPNAWIAARGVPERLPAPQAAQAYPPKRGAYSSQAPGRQGERNQPGLIRKTTPRQSAAQRCEHMCSVV